MTTPNKPTFEFQNHISPRYIESLFIKLETGYWYDMDELKQILKESGSEVEGSKIVSCNATAWSLLGMGITKKERFGRSVRKSFRLQDFGKELIEIYSTNQALFYDMMHYLLYSTWLRTRKIKWVRFWIYAQVCNKLWDEAPSPMHSYGLTNQLQIESQQAFPGFQPAFPERSPRAVFPWLGALSPPFLEKGDNRSQLYSRRRSYCSPQLFHLAADLIYSIKGFKYGTSISMDEAQIEAIAKVCLLDPAEFWQMADLVKMTIRGFEIRKGQWGTSIALTEPPNWIDLPNYNQPGDFDDEDTDDDTGDLEE